MNLIRNGASDKLFSINFFMNLSSLWIYRFLHFLLIPIVFTLNKFCNRAILKQQRIFHFFHFLFSLTILCFEFWKIAMRLGEIKKTLKNPCTVHIVINMWLWALMRKRTSLASEKNLNEKLSLIAIKLQINISLLSQAHQIKAKKIITDWYQFTRYRRKCQVGLVPNDLKTFSIRFFFSLLRNPNMIMRGIYLNPY